MIVRLGFACAFREGVVTTAGAAHAHVCARLVLLLFSRHRASRKLDLWAYALWLHMTASTSAYL